MLEKRLTVVVSIAAAFVGVMLSSTGVASASTMHPGSGARTGTVAQCQGGAAPGWFCLYSGPNFTGEVIGVYDCENVPIPWLSAGSFDDEMVGTRGRIYFGDGSSWSLPPAPTSGTGISWAPVASVQTC